MVYVMIMDQSRTETELLLYYTKDLFANHSDVSLDILTISDYIACQEFLEKNILMDIAFLEITNSEGIEVAKHIRKEYEVAEFLVIADATVSPMEYMIPEIRATSLLLRPFTRKQAEAVINRFIKAFCLEKVDEQAEKVLLLENREGKIKIPYSKIYYIEVREKKIFIRLKNKEYSKYETLENIIKELPKQFFRCHRSFVINTGYINRVKLSQNMIYLEDDVMVPLSRSYKAEMKKFLQGK